MAKYIRPQILLSLSPQEILGLTLIGESRGEPIEGQVAVGCVIRNRLHNSDKHSWIDICLADDQFSCWNEDDPNYSILLELAKQLVVGQKITDPHYQQCIWVASGIVNWNITDNTGGCEYYLTKDLFSNGRPKWARYPKGNPKYIGSQVFFNV